MIMIIIITQLFWYQQQMFHSQHLMDEGWLTLNQYCLQRVFQKWSPLSAVILQKFRDCNNLLYWLHNNNSLGVL